MINFIDGQKTSETELAAGTNDIATTGGVLSSIMSLNMETVKSVAKTNLANTKQCSSDIYSSYYH